MFTRRTFALALTAVVGGGCNSPLDASPEPMGDRVEFGEACEEVPIPTGLGPGDVAPNIIGLDQYGEQVNLYEDLCDKHVVILRAGFD